MASPCHAGGNDIVGCQPAEAISRSNTAVVPAWMVGAVCFPGDGPVVIGHSQCARCG